MNDCNHLYDVWVIIFKGSESTSSKFIGQNTVKSSNTTKVLYYFTIFFKTTKKNFFLNIFGLTDDHLIVPSPTLVTNFTISIFAFTLKYLSFVCAFFFIFHLFLFDYLSNLPLSQFLIKRGGNSFLTFVCAMHIHDK